MSVAYLLLVGFLKTHFQLQNFSKHQEHSLLHCPESWWPGGVGVCLAEIHELECCVGEGDTNECHGLLERNLDFKQVPRQSSYRKLRNKEARCTESFLHGSRQRCWSRLGF